MIYLASPFTHPDPIVRQARLEAACRVAAELTRQGKTVFSPIAHSCAIARYGLPDDWRFLERHDRRVFRVCAAVAAPILAGSLDSAGGGGPGPTVLASGKPASFPGGPRGA